MTNGWIEGDTSEFGGKGNRQENTKYFVTVAWHRGHWDRSGPNPPNSKAQRRRKRMTYFCSTAHDGKEKEHVKRCLVEAAAGGHNIIML